MVKLTISQLKEQLAAAGLEVTGKKEELLQRLKTHLETKKEKEGDKDQIEKDHLASPTTKTLNQPSPVSPSKLLNPITHIPKLTTSQTEDEKRKARAERFGLSLNPDPKQPLKSVPSNESLNIPIVNLSNNILKKEIQPQVLMKRKEKFGESTPEAEKVLEMLNRETLKRKRAERFGLVD